MHICDRLNAITGMALIAGVTIFSAANAADAPAKVAKPWKSSAEIIAASPAADWRDVAANDLVVMDLPEGQVLIELASRFAPRHAAIVGPQAPHQIGLVILAAILAASK